MGNDSFGGQNQVERLADPDPHMILQAGDLVSKDLFRSLSLIPYVKKGDSHTFGEEAGLRETPMADKGGSGHARPRSKVARLQQQFDSESL